MLDFIMIKHKRAKDHISVYLDFSVNENRDLMVRGGEFYAVWDMHASLWSTNEYVLVLLVDNELRAYSNELRKTEELPIRTQYMSSYSSNSWTRYRSYVRSLSDNFTSLDSKVTFNNDNITREDYATRTLPYPIVNRETPSFDKLFETLYDDDNLDKILWMIGAIITGQSKHIQKFFTLYGPPGTGKSTVLNLVQEMLGEHVISFDAKSLVKGNNQFSAGAFESNPLVAINHEGDLSRIEDNSVINSIVSHDTMTINAKYRKPFSMRINTMLIMATNRPVSITEANSGLIRRLVDIRPTGHRLSEQEYDELVDDLVFEFGGIAHKCVDRFETLGKRYFSGYIAEEMFMRTNVIYNFINEHLALFVSSDFVTLKQAWTLYKTYCDQSDIKYNLPMYKFRDEFRTYWKKYAATKRVGDKQYKSVFSDFDKKTFSGKYANKKIVVVREHSSWLYMSKSDSVLDDEWKNRPAQLANSKGTPKQRWIDVNTQLYNIDTSELHYVLPPEKHIVIDFDLLDGDGNKSLALNSAAATKFPRTYAEVSKSGKGIHLHYKYTGDTTLLSRIYSPGIEVLVPSGYFSIRRKLTLCNKVPIRIIDSGLPLKEATISMISDKVVKTEKGLRNLILRNVYKEIHPATKPSVDFIHTILSEAYVSGLVYDVLNLKELVMNFAAGSTNNAQYCISKVLDMPFVSEEVNETSEISEGEIVFFDIEVLPNLLLICWKFAGEEKTITRMINPTPNEVGALLEQKLIGFNNRRYDNHILYAAYMGYDLASIHDISKRIVTNDRTALFREAYSLSYADVYDFSSKKQSLKKWEIELGIDHDEMEIDWDVPLDKSEWDRLASYCDNDVIATEAVFNHNIRDYQARQILSQLSGKTVNDSTLSHTSKIIFGNDKHPQASFNYPDLSETFPGYEYKMGVATYRDETVNKGGYVYSEPGYYEDVVYMDVNSMHPTSIEEMNLFGTYTEKYSGLKNARNAIKNNLFNIAEKLYGGLLKPYLKGHENIKSLSDALKLIINSIYGFTFATFENPFRDDRNKENIVAKRGALFMIDLKHALRDRGSPGVHFKTDSVKIPNHTEEDILFVVEFGKKYGYIFEVEKIYARMVLTNDAVLVGKEYGGEWDIVGARFAKPYVYKTLFSHEELIFDDYTEVKAVVKGRMYIRMSDLEEDIIFVGKVGKFCPTIKGGGKLVRIHEGKEYAVTGTKGYLWMSAEQVGKDYLSFIDMSYFDKEVDDAINEITKFVQLEQLLD